MAAWDIDPQGVQSVIDRTGAAFEPFEEHSKTFLTGCRDAGTAAGSPLVEGALAGFAAHHRSTLLGIRNRAQRVLDGAVKATNHYVRGDEEMAAEAQANAAPERRRVIVPDEVLGIMAAVHPDVVEAEAHDLKKAAGGFRDTGTDVHATWQGLSAYYSAPEAGDLFAATVPVRDESASLAGQLEQVTGALTTYAAETRVIKRNLTDLYMQSVTFVNKTYAEDGDWHENEDLVNKNNSLLQSVNAQALAFQNAQVKAAGSIHAAYGGAMPAGKPASGGKPPPWGTLEEADLPWWQDLWNGTTSLFTGFFQDGLWGDLTGIWDLVTSPSKWWDSYVNLMALGLPAIPVVGQAAMAIPAVRNKVTQQWKSFGKSFVAWDRWKDDPARALGATAYNILTTIVPIGKAGSVGKLAKGTRAAGKAGEAFDPLGLALRAGGRLGQLPKVSDFAARFTSKFGDLPGKLGLNLGGTRVITPHVAPATIVYQRPPAPEIQIPEPAPAPTRTPDTDTPATKPGEPEPTTSGIPNTRTNPDPAPEAAEAPDHVPEWVNRQEQRSAAEQVRTSHERAPELVGARHTDITNSAHDPSNPAQATPSTSTASPGGSGVPHSGTLHSATGAVPTPGGGSGPSHGSLGNGSGGGGGSPLEDRAILKDHPDAPPKDQRFGFGVDLEANKRYVVEDQEGKFRGIFITDENKKITDIHTKSGNKSDGWNPELRRPRPDTIYHVDDNPRYYTDHLARIYRVEVDLRYTGSDDLYRMEDDQRKAGQTAKEEYQEINKQRVADFFAKHQRNPLPHEVILFQDVKWNGGHLVGTATDGPGEGINVVGMLESLNQAQTGSTPANNYRKVEDGFIDLLKSNDPPEVKLIIEVEFPGNQETPSMIGVTYTIDNQFDVTYQYENVPPRR